MSTGTGKITYSVMMPPGPRSVEYARLAAELGYDRIWLYDSAALYEDIWIWLARIADQTDIKIGSAVLVPNLRHVMTTASAIATIERSAPGRLAVGFGTGATARWVLGQPALSWAATSRYIEQLRALLNGETVEIDGARTQMIHYDGWAMPRPIRTPILLSAMGPKGTEITKQIADGIMTTVPGDYGLSSQVLMMNGTVLADGETLQTDRVKRALGPWFVVMYHGLWQAAAAAVDNLPGGAEWRATIEAMRPEGERHLAAHEGHVTDLTPRDEVLLDGPGLEMMRGLTWVGSRSEIRERAEAAVAAGITDVMYAPAGPDVLREMRAFADALR